MFYKFESQVSNQIKPIFQQVIFTAVDLVVYKGESY